MKLVGEQYLKWAALAKTFVVLFALLLMYSYSVVGAMSARISELEEFKRDQLKLNVIVTDLVYESTKEQSE